MAQKGLSFPQDPLRTLLPCRHPNTEWERVAIVGNERTEAASGGDAGEREPVVLTLSRQHAEALATLIIGSGGEDLWLQCLRAQQPRSSAAMTSRPSSPARAVCVEAQAIIDNAHTDIVAEREASDVARAAASAEQSVIEAALTTARAAGDERKRKAHAADSAAQELAYTAARTATVVEKRADAVAMRVADAAAQAAEIVAASIVSGGDAEAALAALQLAATVDAAAIATAEETALAAAAVATAVASAAAQAAFTAAAAAAAFEQEVANAAAAVRMIATAAARDLAVETDAKAVEVALDARKSRRR
jgi:hypothetical protein